MAIGGNKIADMTVGLHFDGSKMYVDMKNITKRAETAAGNSGQSAGKTFSAKWATAMGVVSGIASGAFSKISSMISSSMSGAINRMDIMNNFPKVMQSLGYAADETSGSIGAMADHLDGLPTTLDDMVSNTQQLAASMGNLNKGTVNATSVGLAFNDMMLAGGKGTETASRAFTQYNQMLSKGKVDMQSWNSLVEAAPGQMNQLAESLLGAGKNQRDLYEALQKGTLSFDEMNAAMVRLDKEGGTGFASFNEQAIAGTDGLQTQLENVRTSITKVITAALQGEDMAKPIEQLVTRINGVAKQLIPGIGRIVGGVVEALPQMLTGITDAVIEFVPSLVEGLASKIPVFAQGMLDFLVNTVQKIIPMLPQIFLSIVTGIVDTIKTLTKPENIKAVVQAAIGLLMGLVEALPQILVALIEALPDIIIGIVEFLTDPENIGMIIKAAVDLFMGIVKAIPQILGAIIGALGKLLNKVGEFFNSIIPEPIKEFFGWIGESIGAAVEKLGEFFGWIGESIGAVVGVLAEVFGPAFEQLGQIFGWIGESIGAVMGVIGEVFGFIGESIGKAVGVISSVVGWIWDNVVTPINEFFGTLFGWIGDGIGGLVEFVQGIVQGQVEFFSGVADFIGGIFKGIGDSVSAVAKFIGGVFKGIGDFVSGVFQGIADFIGGIFEAIGGIIKTPINAVINAINGVLSFINGITIPDWVPGIGGWHADIGMIPTLAQGGIAGGTTAAIIGEAGKEAVLPLERNTDNWSGLLASALAEEMANREETPNRDVHIVINNEINSDLDARNISQVVEQAMRRAAI